MSKTGFVPLTIAAFIVSANVSIKIPKPEPVKACLMAHTPIGRDENGVTVMEHRRPCDE